MSVLEARNPEREVRMPRTGRPQYGTHPWRIAQSAESERLTSETAGVSPAGAVADGAEVAQERTV